MIERVTETISGYRMFGPGQRVGVAVSGGADSVALLHALKQLAPRWNLTLHVLHFNHRLRGNEAGEDVRFVEALSRRLGLEFHLGGSDVAQIAAETVDNLEQAARRLRYSWFRQFLERGELDRVAVGQTRSDQAETVLYRLLRGSGTAGVAAIRPVTVEGIVRPLIDVTRHEVEQFLRHRGLSWREDASNADLRFDRNRIRHQLLPELTREWNPNLPAILARMAAISADEEDFWEQELKRHERAVQPLAAGGVEIDLNALATKPRALQRRLIRYSIRRVKGDLRRIDAPHVEDLLHLARQEHGSGRLALPGVRAVRSFGLLRILPPGAREKRAEFRAALHPPARILLPDGNTALHLETKAREISESNDAKGYNVHRGDHLDWNRVPPDAVVRSWQPGDRFQPRGERSGRKLKLLFQRERIPSWERSGWPMIASGHRVIWTRRFGVAEGFAPGAESRMVLRVWETALQ